MSSTPEAQRTADVPAKVFAAFLKAAEAAGLPAAKVAALRATLLDHPDFSENALRNALSAEVSVP
jgi:hypothetical protein